MPVAPRLVLPPGEPGALIVADYQYEFRNFLFGSGTSYMTTKVDGLLSEASARVNDVDLDNEHGSVPGSITLTRRTIPIDITILGTPGTDIEMKLREARRAFQVPRRRFSRESSPLVFQRPGEPLKTIYARCVRREWSSEYEVARGKASGSVELLASDPIIYGLTQRQDNLVLPLGTSSGTTTLHGFGDFEDGTKPTFVITGPWKNPRIQSVTDDDRTIRIDVNLTAVDQLLIDTKARKVQINLNGAGWTDAFGIVRGDNQWWNILPGDNEVFVQRDPSAVGAAGTLVTTWYDTYA